MAWLLLKLSLFFKVGVRNFPCITGFSLLYLPLSAYPFCSPTSSPHHQDRLRFPSLPRPGASLTYPPAHSIPQHSYCTIFLKVSHEDLCKTFACLIHPSLAYGLAPTPSLFLIYIINIIHI